MRKYKQLLLFIITVASLLLLLIYRHEYNRLHYVLEVFNFFGQPCNLTDLIESNKMGNHHDWGPEPIWTEDDSFHVYSSYWLKSNEAKSLILRNNKFEHARNCYLWYEDKPEPVMGKFKYSLIAKDAELESYHYYCGINKEPMPYAVSYVRNKRRNARRHLLNVRRKLPAFNTTVCADATGNLTKSEFVEFLSFHALIGVDSFIVYTSNLPYRLIKIITQLSTQMGVNVTFYNWNFPFLNGESALTSSLIQEDCLMRAMGESKFVAVLSVDEYLVPSTHYTLIEVLSHIRGQSDRFSIPIQKFCVNFNDPKKPVALQNTNIFYDERNDVKVIFKDTDEGDVISEQEVDKDVISLHKYIHCSTNVYKTYDDSTMLKYSTDFIRSTLFHLMLLKQL